MLAYGFSVEAPVRPVGRRYQRAEVDPPSPYLLRLVSDRGDGPSALLASDASCGTSDGLRANLLICGFLGLVLLVFVRKRTL